VRTYLPVLVGFLALYGWSQVPPGYDAASFARIGVGVRAMGLGGAYVAVAEGPSAAYWNPAGLGEMVSFQVEAMYTDWLRAGVFLQYVGAAGYPPLGEKRPALYIGEFPLSLGLNWLSVSIPDIPWVEETGEVGTFTAWSHLFLFSGALAFRENLFLGANVKVFHDRILEGYSLGISWDVGLLWRGEIRGVPLQLGLATYDIGGPAIRWFGTTGEPVVYLPWLLRLGGAVRLWHGQVLACTSLEWALNRPRFEQARFGIEVQAAWLALRFGWNQPLWKEPHPQGGEALAQGNWTIGIGARPFLWLGLDYAFVPSRLGDSHLLAIGLNF
jgi:hypothetical protein